MKRHMVLSLVGALWLGACGGDSTGPSPVQFVVRPEWLTPEVQPFLDADGQFRFPDDWQTREGDMPPAQAMAVAVAWARDGENDVIKENLRMERGTDITFRDLVPCSVPRLLRTPLGQIADETLQGLRNAFGSQWPVLLCTPKQLPMVVLFVSAQSAITTTPDGSLLFPPPVPGIVGGSDLSAAIVVSAKESNRLVSHSGATSSLYSAEEAVARTFEATGRRIAALPRDVGSIFLFNPPGCGRWEMVLESPITVLLDGAPVETDTLFAPGIHCFEKFGFSIASPDSVGGELVDTVLSFDGSSLKEVRIPVELPIMFHPVTIPPS